MCFKGGMWLDKLYSLDLTKEEWNKIINLVLLEYRTVAVKVYVSSTFIVNESSLSVTLVTIIDFCLDI